MFHGRQVGVIEGRRGPGRGRVGHETIVALGVEGDRLRVECGALKQHKVVERLVARLLLRGGCLEALHHVGHGRDVLVAVDRLLRYRRTAHRTADGLQAIQRPQDDLRLQRPDEPVEHRRRRVGLVLQRAQVRARTCSWSWSATAATQAPRGDPAERGAAGNRCEPERAAHRPLTLHIIRSTPHLGSKLIPLANKPGPTSR